MTEHKICKGCPYNHYPECYGTKVADNEFMNIENLRTGFECGQKDDSSITDFSIVKKSELELRVEELESEIILLKEREK